MLARLSGLLWPSIPAALPGEAAEGRRTNGKSRIESNNPDNDWSVTYRLLAMKGLSPEMKYFNCKLIVSRLHLKKE